jgi:hypothetical protein
MSNGDSKPCQPCCGSKIGPTERQWPIPIPPPPFQYNLRGPQVEPESSFWTVSPCPLPCVVRIKDLLVKTDDPRSECYFPPYPTDPNVLQNEISELIELASLRDEPGALANPAPGDQQPSSSVEDVFPLVVPPYGSRRRLGISPFLQMRPLPLGAVFNQERSR